MPSETAVRRARRGRESAEETVAPQRHRGRGDSERKYSEISETPAQRYLRAAAAPFFPKAVRTFLGRWGIVFFSLAAVAAFLTFFRAAAFCFSVLMALFSPSEKDLRLSVRFTIGIAGRSFGPPF
jgi:hypothetical protein